MRPVVRLQFQEHGPSPGAGRQRAGLQRDRRRRPEPRRGRSRRHRVGRQRPARAPPESGRRSRASAGRRDGRRGQRRPGHLPDDRDHADAAAPADEVRVRQHDQRTCSTSRSTAANDLPADEVTEGFSNNAGVLTVSSLHAEKYVLVSETLAKEAVKNLAALTGNCNTTTRARTPARWTSRPPSGGAPSGVPTTAEDRAIPDGRLHRRPHRRQLRRGDRGDDPRGAAVAALPLPARDDGARQRERRARADQPVRAGVAAVVPDLGRPARTTRCWTPPGAASWPTGPRSPPRRARCSPIRRRASRSPTSTTSGSAPAASTSRARARRSSPPTTDAVRTAMKAETPAFVEYVLWTGDRKLETLLTSPAAFVSSALAPIYGVTVSAGRHAADDDVARRAGAGGHPDAGVVPGGAGPPRSDVAGAARKVRAHQADVPERCRRRRWTSTSRPRRSPRRRRRASASPPTRPWASSCAACHR